MLYRLLVNPAFQLISYGLIFSILGVLFAINGGVTNDSWWHLRTGRELWEGTFSFYDSYSWTAKGAYWPAHELGFEWLLYGLWMLGGETFNLMGLLNIALVLASLALLIPSKALRAKFNLKSNVFVPLIVFLAGYTLLGFVQIRAQGLTFFLVALTIRVILAKKPYWLPLILLVWVWLHGSVFIGVAIIGLAALVMIFRYLLDRKSKEKFKDARDFSISGLLSLVATCLSPLGFGIWSYFVDTLSFKDTNIAEWDPLSSSPILLTASGIMILACLLAVRKFWKITNSWEIAFLALGSTFIFIYSLSAIRVYSTLVLMALPLIFMLVMSVSPRDKSKLESLNRKNEKSLRIVSSALTLLLVFVAFGFTVNINNETLAKGSLDPFEAQGVADAVRSEQCSGKLWNEYDTGSYMIWFLRDVPVSIDSRFDLYPEWTKIASRIITPPGEPVDPTIYMNEVFEKYGIACMLMNRNLDTEALKNRGLKTIAENSDMVLLEIPKTGIPARIED